MKFRDFVPPEDNGELADFMARSYQEELQKNFTGAKEFKEFKKRTKQSRVGKKEKFKCPYKKPVREAFGCKGNDYCSEDNPIHCPAIVNHKLRAAITSFTELDKNQ